MWTVVGTFREVCNTMLLAVLVADGSGGGGGDIDFGLLYGCVFLVYCYKCNWDQFLSFGPDFRAHAKRDRLCAIMVHSQNDIMPCKHGCPHTSKPNNNNKKKAKAVVTDMLPKERISVGGKKLKY
eukprot:TRINITY_DN78066_c0_g1_i1.p2 TRINITY_DN78066_c0_g1~~TRINITY_DN78066_c0_g1_i1.p2  ORF type:complete len:125 (-),score=26.06 TRINITY_DN78066_c0_g1_i1:406-780(-)